MLETLKDILFFVALFLLIRGYKTERSQLEERVVMILLVTMGILIGMKYLLPDLFYRY